MAKSASLTAGLVAKKGSAMPANAMSAVVSATVAPLDAETPTITKDYYKSLTVKLDRDRYESLKSVGVKLDKKSQEIFVEALDLWLKKQALPA